ncbi:MAG: hypothetical protein HOL04_00750 [Gammaproteobacteria bacterium]|nr:hypothetical protein [Gammaproteobacteria bacterium]MBT4605818.1 hypothetical protein [Thiotrichales bacterium]MBT4079174.1 hypothetical protein [Gammaproteobacteria bacterium]MBT4329467.1 hypothetical protein [Gammaproteobacteria bacterium]MBT5360249.1 hypothetical protein [Gammaproteobacteria bacterium]
MLNNEQSERTDILGGGGKAYGISVSSIEWLLAAVCMELPSSGEGILAGERPELPQKQL